ncbi:hypothetical protein DSCO28_03430 [Desulfosarcina ovata subsp. sediminis]|uniref:protein O-GlcNAc transferase n=1 Tax=Desulfosarcina ovata subsp. sediminis TaxID=885957 RepID=A0A5K7ZII4_9BACT|nr:tetratricopeptide repeat protein [Desulfosarcina ovata]BBO79777.1 hypothetical protein DSCO28_03430 [Desulfosarcina ovata subsp. sediminis]
MIAVKTARYVKRSTAIVRAIGYHRNGEKKAARQIYRQILEKEPDNPDALHLLGVLDFDDGDCAGAICRIQRAIAINPRQAEYYYNLANALLDSGEPVGAEVAYRRAVEIDQGFSEAYCGLGNALFHQGRYTPAKTSYRKALGRNPDMVNAWFNLGKAYRCLNENTLALGCFKKATSLAPGYTDGYQEMAGLFRDMGKTDAAIRCQQKRCALLKDDWQPLLDLARLYEKNNAYQQAVSCLERAKNKKAPEGLFHVALGDILKSMGNAAEAEKNYRDALRIDPRCSAAYHYLAVLYEASGRFEAALAIYREGARHGALTAQSLHNYARTCFHTGAYPDSISNYRKALEKKPDLEMAWIGLGDTYRHLNQYEDASWCYRQWIKVNPANTVALFSLGQSWQAQGEIRKSLSCFATVLKRDPTMVAAKWHYHLALPVVYDKTEDIRTERKRFSQGLACLIESTDLSDARGCREAFPAARFNTNFYLSYQGLNDRSLQRRYGVFLSRVLNGCFPELAQPKKKTLQEPDERIKVGFVSAHFYAHTVAFLFEGWISGLDPQVFDVVCYHLGQVSDSVSKRIQVSVGCFREFAGDLESFARKIHDDRPDVLIYLDIGMAPLSLCLAALRLAPIQCVSWGHPVTTGLPNVDYFLSSELMEPVDGADHYSEKLIRLPNLSVCLEPPALPHPEKSRKSFGLDESAFIYLSPQSLFKYLPQYDHLFARIAVLVPNARFVFVAHPSQRVTSRFRERLEKTFSQYGLDGAQFCQILPRMPHNDFITLNLICDVVLDPPEWSGGKTSFESFHCGTPVVTLPGRYMRGRHTYGMLRKMAIRELIASDEQDYVRIAVNLAKTPSYFQTLKKKLIERRHLLFHDKKALDGLSRFLKNAVLKEEESR